jgi:phospholipase D
MTKDKLQASGTVRGIFFSFGISQPSVPDPQFDCESAIISLLNDAKNTVHIAIYSLTSRKIVDTIISVHLRNVDVSIVTDATESKSATQASMIGKLTQAGIYVKIATKQKALMHNKVMIVDGQTIATGSYNYTTNAEIRNDENLIIIDGSDVAADYERYVFQRIMQNET